MTVSTTTIRITRPNTSQPFFYDSTYYVDNLATFRPHFTAAVNSGQILNVSDDRSPNNLISTRVITYPSVQDKLDYCDTFYGAFPAYLTTRETYCSSVGHIIEVIEATTLNT
jgi:hypothetical protein